MIKLKRELRQQPLDKLPGCLPGLQKNHEMSCRFLSYTHEKQGNGKTANAGKQARDSKIIARLNPQEACGSFAAIGQNQFFCRLFTVAGLAAKSLSFKTEQARFYRIANYAAPYRHNLCGGDGSHKGHENLFRQAAEGLRPQPFNLSTTNKQ